MHSVKLKFKLLELTKLVVAGDRELFLVVILTKSFLFAVAFSSRTFDEWDDNDLKRCGYALCKRVKEWECALDLLGDKIVGTIDDGDNKLLLLLAVGAVELDEGVCFLCGERLVEWLSLEGVCIKHELLLIFILLLEKFDRVVLLVLTLCICL